jgi:hypothetical protein
MTGSVKQASLQDPLEECHVRNWKKMVIIYIPFMEYRDSSLESVNELVTHHSI